MKNTYRVTLAHNTSANSFYNEVASLSPDPKDIPIFSGYAYTFDHAYKMCSSYRINVTEEDLNFLKLKYNFNSVQQVIPQ